MVDQRFSVQPAKARRQARAWVNDVWQWTLRTRTLRATRLTRGD